MSARARRASGLGAAALLASCLWAAPAPAAEEFDKYAIESASVSLSDPGAGEHADLTIGFELSEDGSEPYAATRDVEIKLPPGMIGNPQAIPFCTVSQLGDDFEESECPQDSQVGVTEVILRGDSFNGSFLGPLYNMPAPKGSDIVGRVGFFAAGYPTLVNVRVDPTDYSLIATVEGASSAAGLVGAETTLWGVPAADSHDALRLTPKEAIAGELPPGGRPATLPEAPFLTNPTDCGSARELRILARSYQLPASPVSKTVPFPQITGCGALRFPALFAMALGNPLASSPSGLDTELELPQSEAPKARANSTLRSAVVTLPQGLAINPAAGAGLESCSSAQVRFGLNQDAACPAAAKIGSLEADVPALARPVRGSLYQRDPAPGNLFRVWLVIDELGVHLKLPGEIQASPLTGQLTAVFAGVPALGGIPQVPVANLKLQVFGGPRAPLATPAGCGTYQAHYAFAPWSGGPAVKGEAPLLVAGGCAPPAFSPGLRAGTRNYSAGRFSPFSLTLTRTDGEPNPQSLALTLPQGLLAKLRGVALCPEAAAAAGACPPESRVGSLTAAAGVGGAPLWIPQPGKAPTAAYLAGPYKGAPYSIVSVVPAQAGPFDLGLVVNRAAIQIDPRSAVATVVTDPLPQILQGVPVSYRTIHVDVDRKDFTLNPTDCSAKQITARVTAPSGAVAQATDGFQAADCAKLRYRPKLRLRFAGQMKRTGNPAVKAILTQKPRQANTAAAIAILPPTSFIDQAHISNPCTRVQFNAGSCPKRSILGRAKAHTPLLDEPLEGPIYFRSNGGARELPDIVADLRGPIHVTLVGFIDSVLTDGGQSSRVRTRFLGVPDAPVSRFTMSFFGGKRGLIENTTNLCKAKPRAKLVLRAQNGAVRRSSPRIGLPCGKRR